MLYARSGGTAFGYRYDRMYGIIHIHPPRNGEGKRKRLYQELGCCYRGLNVHAYRRQFPYEHVLQPGNRYGHDT